MPLLIVKNKEEHSTLKKAQNQLFFLRKLPKSSETQNTSHWFGKRGVTEN